MIQTLVIWRGKVGSLASEYNLSRQILIVSSSGTFVKSELTSKEHINPPSHTIGRNEQQTL